jgi:hypothetical protein
MEDTSAAVAKRKVADRSIEWLKLIEKMTDLQRASIRRRIARGIILTADGTGMLAAMRVYDERVRIMTRITRHGGTKRI